MTDSVAPTLRYLSAADVVAAMPPLAERLVLAGRTMTALVADAELPPKIGVHPRADGSFAHAMPAWLRGGDAGGADDRLGFKWVTGFPANGARGLPSISATVLLSDATTGLPIAILDGGPITAERTAAVSGVAIAGLAPRVTGRAPRVALIGAGVQGHSHVPVIGHVLPGAELVINDRVAGRADALAATALATTGIASATVAASVRDAVSGADVVVSAAAFAPPPQRQVMPPDWLGPRTLVVAIDYATIVSAAVARDATRFLVDDVAQFVANRDAGQFDGYPDPAGSLGEAILGRSMVPSDGRVLVSHLGVGLADVIFGDAILTRASAMGLGTLL
jgi:N-[(2S)-2-amino-2-carboxyethyl]-L-glutamate dehydrogenase